MFSGLQVFEADIRHQLRVSVDTTGIAARDVAQAAQVLQMRLQYAQMDAQAQARGEQPRKPRRQTPCDSRTRVHCAQG